MVIIVADHGENLGEHGLMSHQYCVYDTLVHVPLLIRYPRLFEGGQRIGEQVQSLEIFTTIMDVLGIPKHEIPNDVRGRSLVPSKLAESKSRPAFSEYLVPNLARMRRLFAKHNVERYDRALRSVREDGWKAIFSSDGKAELYDLEADPGETRNLAVQHPERMQTMRARLDEWLASIGVSAESELEALESGDLDSAIVKRLQALGYF